MNKAPRNSIPVFIRLDDSEIEGEDSECEICVGENVLALKGDKETLTNLVKCFCHVFSASINEDTLIPYDFVGSISKTRDNKWPVSHISISRMSTNAGWLPGLKVIIGNLSSTGYVHSYDAARSVASGLAQFFKLRSKDKHGKHYSGILSIEQ